MSRRLNLSQFRGDDEDEEDFLPRSKALELNELKSRTFNHGIQKKTKKDIEREAEERRKKEDEEATAKALAEFEDAFDGPSSGPMGRGKTGSSFVRAGGAPMGPSTSISTFKPAIPTGPAGPPKGPAAMGYARGRAPPRAPSPPASGSKPRGKRAMDSFLEEIKGNQAVREQRFANVAKLEGSSVSALAAWENSSGGRSFNEQESTNLFVGNLPATMTEEVLGRFFADIGPVGTVKIMWPRSELEMEQALRGKISLQGFVAYMKRKDAETAVQTLDGADWGGIRLKVGFSKPVPIPSKALYESTTRLPRSRSRSPVSKRRRSRSRSRSRSPDRSAKPSRSRQPDSPPRRSRGRSRSRSQSYSSSSSYSRSHERSGTPPARAQSTREKWLASIPEDRAKFVRTVVDKVKDKGRGFENVLFDREEQNPVFSFLFDKTLPEYHLYRSLLSPRYRIPTPPPAGFEDEGYASIYSSDSAEDSEKERTEKGQVGKIAKKRLEAMLRVMSGKRAEIARAMEYAVKRAESADEVAEVICQSLKLDNTPVPRKLARLHLVSDILHNSASPLPNVWKYRMAFEKRLPLVFAHFKGVYDSLHAYSGIISADVFRGQVGAVLDVWERWIVFTQEVQDSLRDYFVGTRTPGQDVKKAEQKAREEKQIDADAEREDKPMAGFKSSGFKSSFKPIASAESTTVAEEDLDGEVIEVIEDLDGEALDVDGEAIDEDLDGEVIDDVDGEAMDEDLDGEAI